jgi:putative tRNA adenosine deaminase-associated protein
MVTPITAIGDIGHAPVPLEGALSGRWRCAYGVYMAVQRPDGFAVSVVREDGRWRCARMDDAALGELDAAITELRRIRSTGAAFGMLAVDDEFFILLRPTPGGVALVLSDAAAALDYDVAADVLDLLRVEAPDEEDENVWPEGDLGLLADLGLPAPELQVIIEEIDLYPDEQLTMIAQRCGFAEHYSALLAVIES